MAARILLAGGMQRGPPYYWIKTTCFRIFFLCSVEGDGTMSPSLAIVKVLIEASRASLEVLIATWYMQLGCKREHSTHGKQRPICQSLLFVSGEGATSNFFTTRYKSIQASIASLETLIASWYMQWGCKPKHFNHGKQMLVCQSFTFCKQRGRRGGVRDVCWPKFVGTGMERNAFPFKKDLSLSSFFRFFFFLERVFPLFPILFWISNPVFRRSFPVFSSFHLSKPVPCSLMGLNLAI